MPGDSTRGWTRGSNRRATTYHGQSIRSFCPICTYNLPPAPPEVLRNLRRLVGSMFLWRSPVVALGPERRARTLSTPGPGAGSQYSVQARLSRKSVERRFSLSGTQAAGSPLQRAVILFGCSDVGPTTNCCTGAETGCATASACCLDFAVTSGLEGRLRLAAGRLAHETHQRRAAAPRYRGGAESLAGPPRGTRRSRSGGAPRSVLPDSRSTRRAASRR
jgi:hypothetical protein